MRAWGLTRCSLEVRVLNISDSMCLPSPLSLCRSYVRPRRPDSDPYEGLEPDEITERASKWVGASN